MRDRYLNFNAQSLPRRLVIYQGRVDGMNTTLKHLDERRNRPARYHLFHWLFVLVKMVTYVW